MEGESGVTASMIDKLHSWVIQGHQTDGESDVTRGIIDELHSWHIQGDQWKVKKVLLET